MDLRNWVKNLISLRKRCIPLRSGEYLRLSLDETRGLYAFSRVHGEQKVIIAINASDHSREFQVPVNKLGTKDGNIAQDLLDYSKYPVVNGNVKVSLRPWSGILLGL